MKYTIVRTDTADICIRKIVTFIARNFGEDIALKKLDDLEKNIYLLEDNPYLGTIPRYPVLKRQGYQLLIKKSKICRIILTDLTTPLIYHAQPGGAFSIKMNIV